MATRRSSRKIRRAVADASRTPDSTESPASGSSASESPAEESGPGSSAAPPAVAPTSGSRRRSTAREARTPESPTRRPGRRRRRGGGDDENAAAHIPIGRDGKANISCPNCGTRYKIAEDNLEVQVSCTQCYRTFYPMAAAQSRRPRPDNTKPIIFGVVGVVAIVIVGMIINSLSQPRPAPPKPVVVAKEIDLGGRTAEVRAVRAWAQSVSDRNRLEALSYTNMDAIQKKFDIEKKNPYSRTFGDPQKKLETKILDALFTREESLVFRAYRPSMGKIMAEDMVARKEGRVALSLYPKDSKIHPDSAEIHVSYAWDQPSERFRVHDWQIVRMARAEYLAEKIDGKTKRGKHKKHEIIGAAKKRKIIWAGKEMEIEEAELVSLPHHKDTSPEDRKAIDVLVEKMVDLHASGMHLNRASNALELFGKAAVPRVLNKMYETKLKSEDDVLVLNRLCRFLRHLTGERFGFNPSETKESDIGATDAERVSALKQWYAWWAWVYDRDEWTNIDSDADIEMTQEEMDARDLAEEAAKKAAREKKRAARRKRRER